MNDGEAAAPSRPTPLAQVGYRVGTYIPRLLLVGGFGASARASAHAYQSRAIPSMLGWAVLALLLLSLAVSRARRPDPAGESAAADPTVSQVQSVQRLTPGRDPLAELRQLAELRDQGVISPEEFDQSKARLLGYL